jgi:Protein of unknown function (DUF4238)
MSEPRQHHVIPAFYLTGFTASGTRGGTLHVYDYQRHKHYTAKPDVAARERDFYRVYEPDEDPNVIEQELWKLENELAPVLRCVLASGIVNSDAHQLGELLSLVALIHARGLKARSRISLAVERTMRRKFEAGVVTPDQWKTMVTAEVRAGVEPRKLPSFGEAVRLIAKRRWYPHAPSVLKIGLIANAQQTTFAALADRVWSLARADSDTGGFVCSDTPLAWSEPAASDSPHLDDPNTTITFPLSKELALISRKDRQGTYRAEAAVVAWVNSRTMFLSMGMVLAPSDSFLLMRRNEVARSTDYFSYVDASRRRGILNP